ncbi:MAG TPA: fibrobacter succinogenes major paralogous domain-containing protein [Prolixibacteraceae bacterium]|nr:fibrobacter succinogenes major paralogous domain-containing protein [Prolixibacteraceae bacterium]
MKQSYTIILILLTCFEIVNGQVVNVKTKSVNPNDSVVVRLNNYIGDLQWQKSSDSINWLDVDHATLDTLLIVADQNRWLRALVNAGNCEPFISDMLKIIVKPILYDSVSDIDGNIYKTITYGEQEWMAENLRVTRYADGTLIPLVANESEWGKLQDNNTDRAYCWYLNDSASYSQTYGALYTWAAATNGESDATNPNGVQGACPAGWHIPGDAEWTELEDYLIANGYNYDGSILGNKVGKSLATKTGWYLDRTAGNVGCDPQSNNISGFSAFPSGARDLDYGTFVAEGIDCFWWSSTERSEFLVYIRILTHRYPNLYRGLNYKSNGFCVRCVKDREN